MSALTSCLSRRGTASIYDEASGARNDRAGLRALLDAAHRREFDGVLIWALDRLSREGIGAMVAYLEKFKIAGVVVKSHQESWLDTASPVNDLLLAVFAWVARQERERIRERVKAGVTRARAAGTKFGRPRAIVDARHVERLLAEGLSVREVARQTGYARTTILRRFRLAQKSSGSPASWFLPPRPRPALKGSYHAAIRWWRAIRRSSLP